MAGAPGGAGGNPLWLVELGEEILRPSAPRKAHEQTGAVDRARLLRVVSRTPEVLIKVKHRGVKSAPLAAHLSYITRGGTIEAENERGDRIVGREAVREIRDEWAADAGSRRRGGERVRTLNVIFSMPPGTDPKGLHEAVKTFARSELSNHQYLIVLHTDEKHPHCHVCVKSFGFDGKMLAPDRSDLQLWRERYAACLRERGIAAEATPRRARGVVRKAEGRAERGYRMRGQVSQARRARVQAAGAVLQGKGLPHPAERRVHERQAKIRAGWADLAERLKRSGAREDIALSEAVVKFVKHMPPPATEAELSRAKLVEIIKAAKMSKTRGPTLAQHAALTRKIERDGRER